MKTFLILLFIATQFAFISCNSSGSQSTPKSTDTAVNNGGPDSTANNGIVPPSAAPGNANNSSLADTTYKAKDSKHKK